MRRATISDGQGHYSDDISIHALREESDSRCKQRNRNILISIHALREESDQGQYTKAPDVSIISIHALREESDTAENVSTDSGANFNPRSP